MTHRERWLSTVCDLRTDARPVAVGGKPSGAPRQPGAFRTVMSMLAMYADYDTGANARPSLRLLQSVSHYKHATVKGALDTAESAGYIAPTGVWRPANGGDPVTVWQLGYPHPDGIRPWNHGDEAEAVSPPNGTTDGDPTERNHRPDNGESTQRNHRGALAETSGDSTERQSVTPPSGTTVTPPSGVQPHLPHDPKGVREDESASAPPPEGGARTREDIDAVVPLVFEALAARWQDKHQPVVSNRSRLRIGALLDVGWTPAQIVAAVRTIGTNPRNPSLLLETHLQRQLDDHQPGDYGSTTTTWTGWDESEGDDQDDDLEDVETCPHGISRNPPKGSCQRCTEFQHNMRVTVEYMKACGFTINAGRRDEDGERTIHVSGADRVSIEYDLDRYDVPESLDVWHRHPTADELDTLGQYGDVRRLDPPNQNTYYVLIHHWTPDTFPSVLGSLADNFAPRSTAPTIKETSC